MPCLVLLIVLAFPRVVLVLMFLLSSYLQRAYHHEWLLPALGFVFLPLTTIVYAWIVNTHQPAAGMNLVFLLIAAVIDAGGISGGALRRKRW